MDNESALKMEKRIEKYRYDECCQLNEYRECKCKILKALDEASVYLMTR